MNDRGPNWIANFIWGIVNEALSDLCVRRNYCDVTRVVETEVGN